MVIARRFVRGGLLMLSLTAAMATAQAICRIMRSPSLSEAGPQRTRSGQARSRSASESSGSRPPRSAKARRA
jgi:hypothetical protein